MYQQICELSRYRVHFLTLLTNTEKHYTGITAHLKELTNLSKNKREKRKLQKFSSSHVDEKALSSISCVISFFYTKLTQFFLRAFLPRDTLPHL